MTRNSIRSMSLFLLAAVIMASFGVNAYGDIIVEDNGPLDNRYTWTKVFSGGKYTITILPDCYDFINDKPVVCNGGIIEITSTTNNDVIALLDYQANDITQASIQIKASTNGNRIAAIEDIRDTNSPLGAFVTVDVIGDIGNVDVNTMWQWTVGGNLTGSIITKHIHNLIVGGDITGPISVQNLIELISVNGNISNRIETTNGAITAIDVLGDIGVSGFPVDIKFDSATGNEGMHRIKAANIYANIDATAGPNGGGPFGRLETNGDFEGSLHVNRLVDFGLGESDIDVFNDINADITVDWIQYASIISGGDFNGTFRSEGDFWRNPNANNAHPGIEIGGNLNGTINFVPYTDIRNCNTCPDSIEGPIHVKGNISPTGSILIDRNDVMFSGDPTSALIYDGVSKLGQIVVDGDMLGTVSIVGDITGTNKGIAIGGDLTSSASIAIDGDIDAPITVAGDILDNTITPSISTTGSLLNDGVNSFGSIDILGTKPGSNGDLSGEISIDGNLGGFVHLAGAVIPQMTPTASLNIGGSIIAGSGMEGQIIIDGDMGGLMTIGTDTVPGDVDGLVPDDDTKNIDIRGKMIGSIDITGSIKTNADVAMDTIGASNKLQVHKNLDGFIHVGFDQATQTSGLHGQVIINADDLDTTMGNGWTSTGRIKIGETPTFITLMEPKYTTLPNFLGNGAVGEVRFMLHDEASEPMNNGSGSNLSVIKLRFYGPVKFLDTVGGQQQPGGSKQPLLVEQEITQGNWVDVTSALSFEFKPFDEVNGVFNTSILITLTAGGNIPAGTYQISKTQYLKSDLGGLLWAPVRSFGTNGFYTVTIN